MDESQLTCALFIDLGKAFDIYGSYQFSSIQFKFNTYNLVRKTKQTIKNIIKKLKYYTGMLKKLKCMEGITKRSVISNIFEERE